MVLRLHSLGFSELQVLDDILLVCLDSRYAGMLQHGWLHPRNEAWVAGLPGIRTTLGNVEEAVNLCCEVMIDKPISVNQGCELCESLEGWIPCQRCGTMYRIHAL